MPGTFALTCTVFLAMASSSDPDLRDLLARAERSFQHGTQAKEDPDQARKHFGEAAAAYAGLHERGVQNAALYLNWGNAELLAGNVPQAILAYRRGLRLAPGHKELQENLELAREQVDYASGQGPPEPASWPAWCPRPGSGSLLAGSAFFYLLACLGVSRWLMLGRWGLLGWASFFLGLAALCAFLWVRQEQQIQLERGHPLVIITQETGFFRGNGVSYPCHSQVPTLYPGMEARQKSQRGAWLQIQLPDGALGWVPLQAVLVDDESLFHP